MSEPQVHERDGWRWINRCPRCNAETFHEDDYTWICVEGHACDMPNQEIVSRPRSGVVVASAESDGDA